MSIKANNVKEVLSKNILADGFDPIIDLNKSHHSWLVDARDGSEYLDMFSMYASGSIGYNHPEILAQKEKLAEVSLFKPTLSDIYSTQYADFMEKFNEIAIPKYLKNTFFVEGGGLAVENALKTAFDWKIRKNIEKGIKIDEDMKIIHFKQAFHGRTGYTLSLTNTSDPRKTMYFPKFDWPRIENPYLRFPLTDEVIEDVKKREALRGNNHYRPLRPRNNHCRLMLCIYLPRRLALHHFFGQTQTFQSEERPLNKNLNTESHLNPNSAFP